MFGLDYDAHKSLRTINDLGQMRCILDRASVGKQYLPVMFSPDAPAWWPESAY